MFLKTPRPSVSRKIQASVGNSGVLDPVVPFSWFLRSNTIHVALLFQEANHFEQNDLKRFTSMF